MSSSLRNLRKEYLHGRLDLENVGNAPLAFFKNWLDEAIRIRWSEPTAMVLSTVSSEGKPSSRVVLLKDLQDDGLVFYTHYTSRKGMNIEHNPSVSLLFFWPELERQVRIEGCVEKVSEEESDLYFSSRPDESQIGAIISPQSQEIPDYDWLLTRFTHLNDQIQANPGDRDMLKRPSSWGGYILHPDFFEFWQGGGHRLHDRIACRKENGSWIMSRLAP